MRCRPVEQRRAFFLLVKRYLPVILKGRAFDGIEAWADGKMFGTVAIAKERTKPALKTSQLRIVRPTFIC